MPTAYETKRKFDKTPEPKWKLKKSAGKKGVFVVQKHDASHLHYDFRLEIDGALKSWAVPKGISNNPSDKRLAIETEDHPMDYGSFEGVIPEGNYGAGTVMLWDKGKFVNIKGEKENPINMKKSYEMGMIEVFLEGKKLKGAYALIRFKGQKKNWLIFKMKDDFANKKIVGENKSVKSGKTLEQIAGRKKKSE